MTRRRHPVGGQLDVTDAGNARRGDIGNGLGDRHTGRGGGLILQSDHSVTSAVSGRTYDYVVKLVQEYGTYPLDPDALSTPLKDVG